MALGHRKSLSEEVSSMSRDKSPGPHSATGCTQEAVRQGCPARAPGWLPESPDPPLGKLAVDLGCFPHCQESCLLQPAVLQSAERQLWSTLPEVPVEGFTQVGWTGL